MEETISIKNLRNTARKLEPVMWVGKSGLTQSVIEETKKQLRKRGLVKVKLLKSALETGNRKELSKELAEKTDSVLVDQVGFVAVLYKPIRKQTELKDEGITAKSI